MSQLSLKELAICLKDRLRKPLPAGLAHEPFRAIPVGKNVPSFSHKNPPKPGSVLILFYEQEGRILFPLIQRSEYDGAHSGQVSFPGGRAELGEDEVTAALREGEEEVGISGALVKVIGKLSEFFVIPSNFLVRPVIGYMDATPNFIPDPKEVKRILRADLWQLLSEESVMVKEILAANTFRLQAPHFLIDGQIVWGATAMMLNELRWVVKEAVNFGLK